MSGHDAAGEQDPVAYWDNRYAERDQIWSGNPNQALVDAVGGLEPGRALDLGAGEGADAVWLAEQGWRVTAVDISSRAIERGRAAAVARGVAEDRIEWVAADLASWTPGGAFDLVSACFLHSTVELPRTDILRRAAGAVAAGGHLLIVGHAEEPPWAKEHEHKHDPRDFPTPQQEIDELDLRDGEWETVVSDTRERDAIGPDGEPAHLRDHVLLVRRRDREAIS